MQIPTLFFHAKIPALISLNGSQLGEAKADEAICLPVAPDGVYYVNAQPLVAGFIPLTRKLEFAKGELKEAPEHVRAIIWPGNVTEITLSFEELMVPHIYEPASTIATQRLPNRYIVTLFREAGIHLAVERGEELLFSHTVAQSGRAKIEIIPIENEILVIVLIQSDAGMHCCCVRIDDKITITYEGQADLFRLEQWKIIRKVNLHTFRGHQKQETYNARNGVLLDSKIGFQSDEPNIINGPIDAAKALLDAVRLGRAEELPGLMGGVLSGLTMENLKDFFGDFDHSKQPPASISDATLLGIYVEEPVAKAQLFRFEITQENGWRIINASEV